MASSMRDGKGGRRQPQFLEDGGGTQPVGGRAVLHMVDCTAAIQGPAWSIGAFRLMARLDDTRQQRSGSLAVLSLSTVCMELRSL